MSNIEHELFMSYAQVDGDAAAALLDRLETAGVRCFLAEKSIELGAEWDAAIRQALIGSRRILVLVTPNSRSSIWVAAEIGAAWVLQKPVIPALKDVQASQLDGPLKKYQARRIDTRSEVDALIEAVLRGGSRTRTSRENLEVTAAMPEFNELFNSDADWKNLLRVGEWERNSETGFIVGSGMYRYLLSGHVYGHRPFRIECRLRFPSLRPKNETDAVNAGIVIGWSVPVSARRYTNITFSGRSIFAEQVGFRGKDEYLDFNHITAEAALVLDEESSIDVVVETSAHRVVVTCNGIEAVSFPFSASLVGRVGLRPWRSTLVCEHFGVQGRSG